MCIRDRSWLGSEPKIIENLKSIIPAHNFLSKPVARDVLSQKLDLIFGMSPAEGALSESEDNPASYVADRPNIGHGSKVS